MKTNCQLCGEPMPPGEEMFNYHGYSGPCPKPPLPAALPGAPEPRADRLSDRLSERWQELFWALPSGEMRSKLRALEIDIGRMFRPSVDAERAAIYIAALEHARDVIADLGCDCGDEGDQKCALCKVEAALGL